MKLLQEHTFREGMRFTYTAFPNNTPPNKEFWPYKSSQKPNPVDTLLLFKSLLDELIRTRGPVLSPADRALVDWGHRLLADRGWEQDFWNSSEAIATFLSDLVKELTILRKSLFSKRKGPIPAGNVQTSVMTILNYITTGREAHVREIEALLLLEHSRGSPYRSGVTRPPA